jgi:uncharacterized protein (DUF1778 family)
MLATIVPADFFDQLLQVLDEPAKPNAALKAAAQRASDVVKRR